MRNSQTTMALKALDTYDETGEKDMLKYLGQNLNKDLDQDVDHPHGVPHPESQTYHLTDGSTVLHLERTYIFSQPGLSPAHTPTARKATYLPSQYPVTKPPEVNLIHRINSTSVWHNLMELIQQGIQEDIPAEPRHQHRLDPGNDPVLSAQECRVEVPSLYQTITQVLDAHITSDLLVQILDNELSRIAADVFHMLTKDQVDLLAQATISELSRSR